MTAGRSKNLYFCALAPATEPASDMKKLLLAITALFPMLSIAQVPSFTPIRQPINAANWEFRQAHTAAWKPTQVPTTVHTSLLKNGMIEDPFYRDNEEKLQWIEQEDWEFQCTFDVPAATFSKKHISLILKGLDTYAHVYVNDSLVLESDNSFREWEIDIKKYAREKGNSLHIYFESPLKKVADDWKNLGYELPGGIRTMTRSAQYQYGWDWGPRFVGCGILFKPELLAWDDFMIENIYVTTQSITPELAKLVARIRYRSDFSGPVTLEALFNKRKSLEDRKFFPGVHEDSVTWDVPEPRLWWCNGMGEPYLYDFTIAVKRGYQVVDKMDIRMGIRKIELVTEKDDQGETFYFKLNGKKVFAKGANYIPQDMFQDRVAPDHYKRLVSDAVAANMNMLRVWGGGVYEDQLFYQLCDARGILVWQDFMFACAMYPGNGKFLKTASKEAIYQIERLRQHPCMALWCGNNENNEAWNHWGWQMNFTEAQRTKLWKDYQTLFVDLLPTYVQNDGGSIPYWESSPKYGRANPKSLTEGDSHYWGVWHDEEPFEIFNKKVPRFMSEYGFQSFPEWRTIKSFTLPEDRQLASKVMLLHQKHPRGNAIIAEYMKRDFRPTKNFEDFVYVSQILQAEGMRTGIEAHRRNKPYCMGTLYWQLNDAWPVASWASIDYFGRWKAMHYYVRDAYSPVASLPIVENDILKIYGVNDLPDNQKVTITVRALSLDGKVLSNVTNPDVTVAADSSRVIWEGYLKTVLDRHKSEDVVVEIILKTAEGKLLHRRLFYLVPPRKLMLPRAKVATQVTQVNDGYEITLQCDRVAKNVLISTDSDGFFQDNYFDLLPGERKTVLFKTDRLLDTPQSAFRVRSLVDTYE